MKKKLLSFIPVLLLMGITGLRVQAQNPMQASATGHIFAEVITVFSAVETSQMNFGRFSPGPLGGKIILDPRGAISLVGSVVHGGGLHNAASFQITGDNNYSFSISLPDSPAILTNTANAKTMTLSDWVSVPSTGAGVGTLQNGSRTVYVGATLEVGLITDNPVGIYTGTYTVTFDFN